MAILPKHSDQYAHYDPRQDLTQQQLQRFTQTANSAQQKKERLQHAPTLIQRAKQTALKPVIRPHPRRPNITRYIAWLMVFGAVYL
ncbi:MAG: hypothetical protein ACRC0U_09040 [Vibrio sp.]